MTDTKQVGADAPSSPREAEETVPRLTRPQFWGALALLLVIFAVGEGAVWQHPWDMARLNGAIVYSYLPIPLIVAACLLVGRRLTLRGFFLDVLEISLLKYSVTFTLALVLWARAGAPPAPDRVSAPQAITTDGPSPAPTPIDPDSAGALGGVVVDASSRPVEGALVFIARGLEDHIFAPPTIALELVDDGSGITPRLSAVRRDQRIEARSTDGQLHTLVASLDGAVLFNIPLMGSGAPSVAFARGASGVATLRCTVHPAAEGATHLGVFAHPFFAMTGADGRFRWSGVPAGALRVSAFRADGQAVSVDAQLAARGETDVRLAL